MSKGSTRRPPVVDRATVEANWARTFAAACPCEARPWTPAALEPWAVWTGCAICNPPKPPDA